MIIDVTQGLPGWVSADLLRGFLIAVTLTSLSGILIRHYADPNRNPTPFLLVLICVTILGSTIYILLGGPGFRPVRPYAPYGYQGYQIGCMTGLLLLAVVSALRPRK